jgi:hypothetical protein
MEIPRKIFKKVAIFIWQVEINWLLLRGERK